MRTPFLQLSFFFIVAVCFGQQTNNINYTIDDGLPSNVIYGVIQDDEGFMWFGSDSGLIKYDGYEFTTYTPKDGLPDIEILKFFKDTTGRIWFYTLNGKLGFLHKGSIFSSQNTPWLEALDMDGRITSIIEAKGKLFFSSLSMIKVYDGALVSQVELQGDRLPTLCFCQDRIYIFTLKRDEAGKRLFSLNIKTLALKELVIGGIASVPTYPICFEKSIISFFRQANAYVQQLFIDKDSAKAINQFRNERLLNLEVFDSTGFLLFGENEVSYSSYEAPLDFELFSSLKSVSSHLRDNEQNLWFTSIKNGIYFQPKTPLNIRLLDKQVSALYADDSTLLVAFDNNNLETSNGVHRTRTSFNNPNPNRINSIKKYKEKVYIANNGWGHVDSKAYRSPGISISVKNSNSIIVGGRYYIKETDSLLNIKSILRFPTYVRDIAISNDSIYLGTGMGLLYYDLDTVSKASKSPLLEVRINDMQTLENNDFWLATGGNGLLNKNGSGISQISVNDGLASNICNKLVISDSIIWVATPKGINKVDLKNGSQITLLDKSNGLSDYYINDLASYKDSIYIATRNGLFSFSNSLDLKESNSFKLYIDRVMIDNVQSAYNRFEYNVKSISITFKALVYKNHNSLTYQYKLINSAAQANSQWIEADVNQVNFSSLEPNKYSFLVRAKTKNSDWSPPISYEFEIVPAFWQRTSFQVAVFMILIIISSIAAYRYFKSKNFKKELERAKTRAEIKALKAQINPHFLFNALNSIQSFVLEGDLESSDNYLVKYGKLIRKVLDHSDKLTVTLSDELEMLDLYVALEKLRFDKGFDYKVNLAQNINPLRTKVPSMVIQPFIENAIWHGLSLKKGKREIRIEITKLDRAMQVLIIDNGVGFKKESVDQNSKHSSKGTKLVSERLALLGNVDGITSQFEIKSKPDQGTEVKLTFPGSLD